MKLPANLDLNRVEALASRGVSVHDIGRALGVKNFTRLASKHPGVRLAVEKGKASGLAAITDALFNTARGGNVQAQMFYLKNRDPERWTDRSELALRGQLSVDVTDFEVLEYEEPKRLARQPSHPAVGRVIDAIPEECAEALPAAGQPDSGVD